MPIRYIPIDPIVLRGQAVLGNFSRTLRYSGNHKPGQRLSRGLPLYELRTVEHVRVGARRWGVNWRRHAAVALPRGINCMLVPIPTMTDNSRRWPYRSWSVIRSSRGS